MFARCYLLKNEGFSCPGAPETFNHTLYFYNSSTKQCETFNYLGCGGNDNQFPDFEFCDVFCNSQEHH
ncbi:hypothetical protein PVAND_015280 [Polypedilum vanderplanki]|uniref:BPTI/Kunitz inhibitor domain-containing protein n=1 Tax=Polypedilum vanderplanki TaxID=319348 RepID=A0A9J6BCJ7_POLVA|nr:hypothetical protein PVAND_015280 [Polypedilum vanderplanki]